MITCKQGDIFASGCQALVNPVNCMGISGKGLALEFRKRYPEMDIAYRLYCVRGQMQIGGSMVHCTGLWTPPDPEYIICFPTKKHWRDPSEYEYIHAGLFGLAQALIRHDVESVAIPALGCGNGGLEWKEVKILIEQSIGGMHGIRIELYAP